MFKGVTLGYYAANGYFGSPEAKLEIDRIAELEIPWICLVCTVMQDAYYSTRMYRDFKNTPGDDELVEIIDYIHSKNIKVMFRPMLECHDGTQRGQIIMPQGEIQPGMAFTYRDQWFENYAHLTRHYTKLAEKTGCEAYCFDSELNNLIGCSANWVKIVEIARSIFSGHLTTCFIKTENYIQVLDDKDFWFYALDSVSTSFYTPATPDGKGTIESMVEYMRPQAEKMQLFYEKYGKPFYCGECGCCAVENATKLPYFWKNGKYYDGQQQADYMAAVIRLFEDYPWWDGMFWWKWDQQIVRPDFLDDPAGDKGFTIYGKPAAEVMHEWCKKK